MRDDTILVLMVNKPKGRDMDNVYFELTDPNGLMNLRQALIERLDLGDDGPYTMQVLHMTRSDFDTLAGPDEIKEERYELPELEGDVPSKD